MAWFKPARNRDHPGDAPPKWAPISRAGRLVLVVTVIAGIVIALLIVATRSADAATVATEVSPPSWVSGQRVESPWAGLAVTLPADWVVQFAEDGSDLSILAFAPDDFGPEVSLLEILVARAPNMQERDAFTFCSLVRYAPIELTADEFLLEVFELSDSIIVESLRDGLSRVLVNAWLDSRISTEVPEAFYVDHYAIGGDDAVAVLWCAGVIDHRDTWLSIAESVEFTSGEA